MIRGKLTPITPDLGILLKKIPITHPGVLTKMEDIFLLRHDSWGEDIMNDFVSNGHVRGYKLRVALIVWFPPNNNILIKDKFPLNPSN